MTDNESPFFQRVTCGNCSTQFFFFINTYHAFNNQGINIYCPICKHKIEKGRKSNE